MHLLPDLGRRTLIMGILNVTPDSFSDGGDFAGLEAALAHAAVLRGEGADIIDIGGESTRPTATPVATEDEIARVEPVIRALAPAIGVPISIDTYKAATAEAALAAGATIVNDIWGLQREPEIARVAAAHGAPAAVKVIHAGLECGLLGGKYPDMDMVSFGPTIHGAHAPGEAVEIASVEHCWRLLREILSVLARQREAEIR